jgi:hypothetical protein
VPSASAAQMCVATSTQASIASCSAWSTAYCRSRFSSSSIRRHAEVHQLGLSQLLSRFQLAPGFPNRAALTRRPPTLLPKLRGDMSDVVAALTQRIAEAFKNGPQPARTALVYAGSWETGDLRRNLANVRDTPTDQFIEWHADSLPVFTPQGLRHVLPYYMRYSLRHPRSEAAERLIFHLSPAETDDDYWRARLNVFSRPQKEVICAFLNFLEKELAGEHYESHFARARVIWGCSEAHTGIKPRDVGGVDSNPQPPA